MRNMHFFVFLFLGFFIHCDTDRNEDFLFKDMEKTFDPKFITEFKNTSENNLSGAYFSYFLYKYDEIKENNNAIEPFFNSLNLNEEPAQSYALLFSWHRKLNHKKINLEDLTIEANDSIKGVKSCINIKKINSVYNYRNLNISNDIRLRFPVRTNDNVKSTVFYGCPTIYRDFNDSTDLVINGKLVNKYYNDTIAEFCIQVEIKDMNRKDVLYFFSHIEEKDTIGLSLVPYGIKI